MNHKREEMIAKNTIQDGCVSVLVDGVQWYDTEWLHHCKSVQYEVKYLSSRGVIVHHPLVHKLVRFA